MTPTPLTGFIIHSRPYQEKRAIYQLFSKEWGVVHGVGVRGVLPFMQIECFVAGKNSLKNFNQIHLIDNTLTTHIGQNQYALLYLNELICKLIAPENPCPTLWYSYQNSVVELKMVQDLIVMKQILRQFERVLFDELGVAIDWACDSMGRAIEPDMCYEFAPNTGFAPSKVGILGESILAISDDKYLNVLGQIHRQMIDFLLDYKPLNSRKLWAEQLKYR
ncbi:DNA repair protein RecO [Moraxella oblonga]|uniref:DNA repair protein RecO n=1 Tax=Moraxella oblonga TaxID=200413 RepID=UPI00082C5082|nr:DNA repair protein RecO C-terminal domain-containing protein [Moraxella oblonga]